MSLRGKGKLHARSKPGKGRLGKLGGKLGGALSGLSGMRGHRGVYGRRRSKGITSRQFRTAQRVLKKIVKMYTKLPRRAAHHGASCARRSR